MTRGLWLVAVARGMWLWTCGSWLVARGCGSRLWLVTVTRGCGPWLWLVAIARPFRYPPTVKHTNCKCNIKKSDSFPLELDGLRNRVPEKCRKSQISSRSVLHDHAKYPPHEASRNCKCDVKNLFFVPYRFGRLVAPVSSKRSLACRLNQWLHTYMPSHARENKS